MSDPIFITGFGQYYYFCDRDPTATESDFLSTGVGCYVNVPDFKYSWFNTVSWDIFWCVDNTLNAMVWRKLATNSNVASMISSAGWALNTPRNLSSVSLAFNTSRKASSTLDVYVVVNVSQTSALLTPATVNLQIDTGGGFSTIATCGLSGIVATQTNSIGALVPANASYKVVSASGTNSISSITELQI